MKYWFKMYINKLISVKLSWMLKYLLNTCKTHHKLLPLYFPRLSKLINVIWFISILLLYLNNFQLKQFVMAKKNTLNVKICIKNHNA